MAFSIFVSLVVRGVKYNPDEISSLLNLEATKSYVIGDEKRAGCGVFHVKNGWHYEIKSDEDTGCLNDLLESLVRELRPVSESIRTLSEDMEVIIFNAIYKKDYWPPMRISSSVISFFSNTNATIDFDLYETSTLK